MDQGISSSISLLWFLGVLTKALQLKSEMSTAVLLKTLSS